MYFTHIEALAGPQSLSILHSKTEYYGACADRSGPERPRNYPWIIVIWLRAMDMTTFPSTDFELDPITKK